MNLLLQRACLVFLLGSTSANANERLADAAQRAVAAVQQWAPTPQEGTQADRNAVEVERQRLRDALMHELEQLGRQATPAEIESAVRAFGQQHAEALDAQQAAQQSLVDRLDRDARDDTPDAVVDFRFAVFEKEQLTRDARKQHQRDLAELVSVEARETATQAFHEQQRACHDQLKEALKLLRKEIRTNANAGARRIDE